MCKAAHMTKIDMPLVSEQKLWVFSEVVKCGSVTTAAKNLCMSQPAVSTIMRQLEQHFAVKLFNTVNKKIQLTPAARMLYQQWTEMKIAIHNLHHEMQQFANGLAGHIRIAMVSSGKYFVPRIMCSYLKKYPNITFDCDILHREAIIPSLEKGLYDIGILTDPAHHTQFSKFHLGSNKLIYIAHPNHPMAKKKKIFLKELADEPFIIREHSALMTQMLLKDFQDKALDIKILLEIDSTEAIKQTVIAGLAIALVPQISVSIEIDHNILKKIPVVDSCLENQWYIIFPKSLEKLKLMHAFINYTRGVTIE